MRNSLGVRARRRCSIAARTRTGDAELLAGAGRERTGRRGAGPSDPVRSSRLGRWPVRRGAAPRSTSDGVRAAREDSPRTARIVRDIATPFAHSAPARRRATFQGRAGRRTARVGRLASAGARAQRHREERLRCARARVEIAGVRIGRPRPRLPGRHAGFEFRECFLHAALRQPQRPRTAGISTVPTPAAGSHAARASDCASSADRRRWRLARTVAAKVSPCAKSPSVRHAARCAQRRRPWEIPARWRSAAVL